MASHPSDEVLSSSPTVDHGSAAEERRFHQGQVLANRYEIRHLLGSGGMGEVWLAFDLRLRVEVALKTLLKPTTPELLHREIRAAREVISPNVCRIFDLVEADGVDLISMEYVDGITLRKLLDEKSPLPIDEAHEMRLTF